jgi:carbamoyl-phosphate synthase large subunit
VQLIINTPSGKTASRDEILIRTTAVRYGVPLVTTIAGAQAAVSGIEAALKNDPEVRSIQEYMSAKGD